MQGKLTQRLVDSLKPAEKVYIVRDTDLTGFILRVQPTGHMAWYLDYRNAAGRRRSYRLGAYPGLKPEGARRLCAETAGKVAGRTDVQAEKQTAREEAERTKVSTLG